ncbi:leukocyte surface antigen CD53 [Takifugu rubripes]|uniref:Tetraspanin n=1 Tax=Takifugu rubripes TaxID=31033 RepID=H2RVW7_TAKRU|nr:leukocyte surface antigen CD53-like [Takifugu rubripes]|eukprot:XP_003978141.1 PREDICTED: leukocyte surface antigen CD53-like [Takifugu rubripes]
MAQRCLKCLKFTMCAANFLCFICGVAVLGLGIWLLMNFRMAVLTPSLASFNMANILLVSGIIITCVSFLGFMGALKENRCLLLTFFLLLFLLMLMELTAACILLINESQIGDKVKEELFRDLQKANSTEGMGNWDLVQNKLGCCGVNNYTDWGTNIPNSCCVSSCNGSAAYKTGCLEVLKNRFEENYLTTGISVIVICIIEVLGMCFAMTLFCHISKSGLGYKL